MADPALVEAIGACKYAAAIKLLTPQIAKEGADLQKRSLLLDRAACYQALGLGRKALKVQRCLFAVCTNSKSAEAEAEITAAGYRILSVSKPCRPTGPGRQSTRAPSAEAETGQSSYEITDFSLCIMLAACTILRLDVLMPCSGGSGPAAPSLSELHSWLPQQHCSRSREACSC